MQTTGPHIHTTRRSTAAACKGLNDFTTGPAQDVMDALGQLILVDFVADLVNVAGEGRPGPADSRGAAAAVLRRDAFAWGVRGSAQVRTPRGLADAMADEGTASLQAQI